jgi:hypothetical protein
MTVVLNGVTKEEKSACNFTVAIMQALWGSIEVEKSLELAEQ